ncbi:MAG: copper homeostasis protein CutC [Erysipelotrichaceae bacterium]
MEKIIVEVCCGSVDDCIVAQECHADRIELNHALEMGGMSVSPATLRRAKAKVSLPICCMVRPRGVGFCYSEDTFEVMKEEARDLLEAGADGIVFGFLHEDGSIDIERTKAMVEIIHPKEAVFHKAFDATENLEESLKILIDCKIDRVLTSGGAVYPDIKEGCIRLAKLHEKYGDIIQLLPGGGVREHNVLDILETTNIKQIHMTAKHLKLDPSTLCFNQNSKNPSDHSFVATEQKQLCAILDIIRNYESK